MEDRRRQPRTRVSRRAYVSDARGNFYYHCFIRDASRSGCRIYTPDALDVPDLVWVFPDGLKEPIAGTIAWRRRHMAGISFVAAHAARHGEAPVLGGEDGPPTFEAIEARMAARAEARRQVAGADRQSGHEAVASAGAVRAYFANIIHELKGPIASLRGALALVIDKALGTLPARVRDLLMIAERNAARVEAIANDYLDVERLDRARIKVVLEPADIVAVARAAVAEDSHFLQMHGVTCRIETPDGEVRAAIDRQRIQQVLSNLITNAAKFSPSGGDVVIRIERRGGAIRVSVIDRGTGIAPEALSRIFDRFARNETDRHRAGRGSGLGLSICKAILAVHGAEIQVSSVPGEGSIFFFELPETAAVATRPAAVA